MPRRRFVVLDRDGTLIVERNYLLQVEQVELIPGVAGGLRCLRDLGLGLIVVTNQSAIGRGYFDRAQLDRIHRRVVDLLAAQGASLDGIYCCPHVPEDDCACRKPKPGLLHSAARDLGFDPAACFVIGDKPCDIELGQAVGAITFLVRTGYGAQHIDEVKADRVVADVAEAARVIERLLA